MYLSYKQFEEIKELKQELKQKSNENDNKLKLIKDLEEKTKYLYSVNEFQNYNSEQLAIEELEKIGNILVAYFGAITNPDGSIKKYDCVIPYQDFDNYLTQRIKELRGEKWVMQMSN